MRPGPALLLAALVVLAASCGREERVRRLDVVPVSNVLEERREPARRRLPAPTPTPRPRPIAAPASHSEPAEPLAAE